MKIGVQLPEVEWEVPFPEYLAMAQTAEAVGFDSLWVGDHLLYDLPAGARGPWEAWTTLAAIAAVTDRIEIGPLVASTSFHAPPMLAKQAATVDAISQGRLILGLGAGWNRREYDAFGFAYDRRVSRFEEAFTIIRSLLRDGEIDFHGTYYDAERCVLHPRSPRPAGPPLMVGSNSMEIVHLINAGMTDLEAIEAMTATAPETLGPQAPTSGQLVEGYDADVIALDTNPLDDRSVWGDADRVTHVWKAGVRQK